MNNKGFFTRSIIAVCMKRDAAFMRIIGTTLMKVSLLVCHNDSIVNRLAILCMLIPAYIVGIVASIIYMLMNLVDRGCAIALVFSLDEIQLYLLLDTYKEEAPSIITTIAIKVLITHIRTMRKRKEDRAMLATTRKAFRVE